MSTHAPDATVGGQVKLAAEAYLYGYPLMYDLHEVAAFAVHRRLDEQHRVRRAPRDRHW